MIILRYAPDIDTILKEILQYNKQGYFKETSKDLLHYFSRKTSKGCLMVEKENGPDEYIDDLRQDIFERFGNLLYGISKSYLIPLREWANAHSRSGIRSNLPAAAEEELLDRYFYIMVSESYDWWTMAISFDKDNVRE